MIKCPNCGSTAQVKFDYREDDRRYYSCGCGCFFYHIPETIQIRMVVTKNEKTKNLFQP